MAIIPRLQHLCIGKITTEIWENKISIHIFVAHVRSIKCKQFAYADELPDDILSQNIEVNYIKQFECISKQIMDLVLPEKIKLRICAAMLNVQRDAFEFSLDSFHLLADNKIENMIYIMSKLYFTPVGRVDRFKTILASIIDSFGNLEIKYTKVGMFCCFNDKYKADEFIKNYKYTKYKNVKNIVQKLQCRLVNIWASSNVLLRLALNGSNNILEYIYNESRDVVKPKFLCRLLIYLINNTFDSFEKRLKIIFIYERLNHDVWINVIKQYGNKLLDTFLMSEQIDYCIHFYKQVCLYAPHYCLEVLENAFDKFLKNNFEYCSDIFKKLIIEEFLCIWFDTPADIKNDFIRDNDSIDNLCRLYDYELLSTILYDPSITKVNRTYLIDYLILSYRIYSTSPNIPILLDKITNEFRYGDSYIDIHSVKNILQRKFFFYENKIETKSILSDNDLIELKTLVKEDRNFIKNIIMTQPRKYYLTIESVFTFSAINFALKWKFEDRDSELIKYITEVFIYEDIFVSVFYLVVELIKNARISSKGRLEHKYILSIINEQTVRQAILIMLKQSDFVKRYFQEIILLQTQISENLNPYSTEKIPYFFEDLLTKDERKREIKVYLLSEVGLRDVLKNYIINYAQEFDLQTIGKDKLLAVYCCCSLFKKHWLDRFALRAEFIDYMLSNSKEVYQKHFNGLNSERLLPNQSLKSHKTIVNAFYKLFISILMGIVPHLNNRGREFNFQPWDSLENDEIGRKVTILANMIQIPSMID